MGTGGRPKTTPTQRIYIVASESNSGYNMMFSDEDMFFDEGDAERWRDQKNAGYAGRTNSKTMPYEVRPFDVRLPSGRK